MSFALDMEPVQSDPCGWQFARYERRSTDPALGKGRQEQKKLTLINTNNTITLIPLKIRKP